MELIVAGRRSSLALVECKNTRMVSLPASASLAQLVRLAHHRWAIEQRYQDLTTELGLDHFEGRS